MSEMVQRVARGAFVAWCVRQGQDAEIVKSHWGSFPDNSLREIWAPVARAAIEAMREPTPTMCQARGDMSDEDWLRVMPQDVWKSMIDEALK